MAAVAEVSRRVCSSEERVRCPPLESAERDDDYTAGAGWEGEVLAEGGPGQRQEEMGSEPQWGIGLASSSSVTGSRKGWVPVQVHLYLGKGGLGAEVREWRCEMASDEKNSSGGLVRTKNL